MPHEAEPVVIYHNPGCGTSRAVLEAIRARGIEPQVVRYLQAGWTRARLLMLLDALALKPRDLLRGKHGHAAELAEKEDEAILSSMIADPSLVERPIVTTAKGAALCRPASRLASIL
ncbi:MAG: arsenate reductase (glutaredoxin) [Caulobacteraceae bacterium]|nr:arsenate reductase (glutaredoxin) [Caulobacter sp.]